MKPFDDILTRRSQRLKFIGGKDDFIVGISLKKA